MSIKKDWGTWHTDLFLMDLEQLKEKYGRPKTQNSLDNLRKYWRKRGVEIGKQMEEQNDRRFDKADLNAFERLLERSGLNPDDIETVARLNIWQASKKGEDGEWDTIDQYAMQIKPKDKTLEDFEPIEPARITPTRRKMAKRSFRLILAYGDGQVDYRRIIDPQTGEEELIPIHDIPAHNVIKKINAHFQPETTVNLGDFADMASLSRFDPSSDHFHKTLGPSMRYIHDFYAQMRADNPSAEHVEVDSNHAIRIKKQVLKNMPAMHDFVRPGEAEPYPMMTYYYLANLGKLGIKFVSGYGAAAYVYGRESGNPILFKHGNHATSSLGATVRKEAQQNPNVNVVRGHGHRSEMVRSTIDMPSGERRQLFYAQLGSTCLNNGMVEGYHSAIDDFNRPVDTNVGHQTTIAMIEDYGGRYNFNEVEIVDGKAFYQGVEFDGNEED